MTTIGKKSYSLKSRARAIQVNKELQSLKKRAITIADYMLKIKLLSDELKTTDYTLIKK